MPSIARKTGLGESNTSRTSWTCCSAGEERLLEAVLHGKIPSHDCHRHLRVLRRAVPAPADGGIRAQGDEPEDTPAFKRIVDLRRYLGKSYGPAPRKRPGLHHARKAWCGRTGSETQRQKIMVSKSKLCEARLLSVSAAFRVLVADEDYINLLRAEELDTMPKFLAERARQAA